MKQNIHDRNGAPVNVGTAVRLLRVPEWLLSRVSGEEAADLQSMVGEVFIVHKIDKWGGVWLEKWFTDAENEKHSHSLSPSSEEFEVVEI